MKNFDQVAPGAFINIEGGALVLGFRCNESTQILANIQEVVSDQVFWGILKEAYRRLPETLTRACLNGTLRRVNNP